MRDGLSLLDQAIAYGGGKVLEAEVRAMLGAIEQSHVLDLLNLLAANDAPGLLARINELAQHSPDFAGVLAELMLLGRLRVDASRKRKLVRVEDPTPVGDPLLDEVREHLTGLDFHSIMVIPLTFGGDVLGTLCVRTARQNREFSEQIGNQVRQVGGRGACGDVCSGLFHYRAPGIPNTTATKLGDGFNQFCPRQE